MANKEELPKSTTLTIMFTDIVGSTAMANALRNESGHDAAYMENVRKPHDDIIRQCLASHDGYEVKTIGDSFMAVFERPQDAIETSACIIERLESSKILPNPADENNPLKVRIGLHTGTVYPVIDSNGKVKDYEGHDVNTAARVESIAAGNQILLSRAVMEISGEFSIYKFHNWNERKLKGIKHPVEIFELQWGGRELGPEPKGGRIFNPPSMYDNKDFIGRDEFINDIKVNIEKNKLLTISGIGGVGKTVVAIKACKDIEDEYDVFFIAMDKLNDKSSELQIIGQIAQSMKLQGDAPKNLAELKAAIKAECEKTPVLLLIDNYESIDKNGFNVIKELTDIERLTILLTSTLLVGIDIGKALELKPFDLNTSDSYQLFELRVRRLTGKDKWKVPDVDEEHVKSILEITDGIPLAIELVASRMNSYTCQQVAESLKKSLELIAVRKGDREKQLGPKRHLSIEECLYWSYEKLSPSARMLFRAVSLFANGFEVALVEDCYRKLFPKKKCNSIQYLLEEIQASSLISFDDDGKWRFLPIVHRYGKELLNNNKNISAIEIEKAFISYWDKFVKKYSSSDEKVQSNLYRLEKEHGHLIEFLNLLRENEENYDIYVVNTNYLSGFWETKKMWGDSLDYLKSALEIARSKANKDSAKYQLVVAITCGTLANLLNNVGDMYGAKKHYEEALELFTNLSDQPNVAANSNNLAGLLIDMGVDIDRAKALLEDTLQIYKTLSVKDPDKYQPAVAKTYNTVASLLEKMDDMQGAKMYYEKALKIFETLSDAYKHEVGSIYNNLANLLKKMGNMHGAEVHYKKAFQIRQTLSENDASYKPEFAETCFNYANLLNRYESKVGDREEAKKLYEEALKIFRPLSEKYPAAYAYLRLRADVCHNFAILLQKMNDDKGASELIKEEEAIRKRLSGLSH
ncbi:MAG: tetratricopeptide repeat protein [Nitrospirae bacterium]|nr:tetratricopeptide repeat protein [Nitrospirota bacterium]